MLVENGRKVENELLRFFEIGRFKMLTFPQNVHLEACVLSINQLKSSFTSHFFYYLEMNEAVKKRNAMIYWMIQNFHSAQHLKGMTKLYTRLRLRVSTIKVIETRDTVHGFFVPDI